MPLDMDPNSKPIVKIFNKEELTIGRLPSNDVVLNRPEVSGIHARLRIEHDEFGEVSKLYITDLGSSNGTLVEKNPLKPRVEVPMMPSERIFIGSYVIKPTSQMAEDVNDAKTTIEVPRKAQEDDFKFAAKTQTFDNVNFQPMGETAKEEVDEDEVDDIEEERVAVNSSMQAVKNPYSSIMFGSEPAQAASSENDSSVLRSMYASPNFDAGAGIREPEARLSPFGRPYVIEDEEEEDEEEISFSRPAGAVDHTVEARPTWAQVKEDYLEEKEESLEDEIGEDHLINDFDEKVGFSVPEVPVRSEPITYKAPIVVPEPEAFKEPVVVAPAKVSFDEPVVSAPAAVQATASASASPAVKHIEKFSIRVKAGAQSELAFKVQAKAFTNIQGQIMHKGVPLAGVTVRSSAFGHTTTDAAGRYEFMRVLEDTAYSLTFDKDQYVIEPSTYQGTASVNSADFIANAIKLYSIKGVVSHNGQPLSGVEVDAGELGKKITGPDGVYQFDNVPEDREYDLVLSKEGYAFQS